MYLHIGKECILNNNELIGIFNIETLKNKNGYDNVINKIANKTIDISAGKPKTLILVARNNEYIAYISNILSSTIASRVNKF